ncbi:MAG: hypothetical protein UY73_C0008G0011 [Parcubacteria group bacterium GW2011_GWA2_52_8]|nr:MAG: hypothetical protein UY73_C0008G0011 [Parcubacteria group bacterium GW2011_GWA2_52_8]
MVLLPQDFESCASASSAIPASGIILYLVKGLKSASQGGGSPARLPAGRQVCQFRHSGTAYAGVNPPLLRKVTPNLDVRVNLPA